METLSRTGSCHPSTLLGMRHILRGGGRGRGRLNLLRRQKAVHDLIKKPIKGLRKIEVSWNEIKIVGVNTLQFNFILGALVRF